MIYLHKIYNFVSSNRNLSKVSIGDKIMHKIIDFSIRYKLIIILITLTIVGFGTYSILNIPVGAVPDITNNQVQVITTSGNLSTQEIEQFITAPVEMEMANLPGVKEIRSVSKFGLSVVTIVFDEKLGTYLPRQLIAEKIKSASAQIPEGFGTPEMGPITTGLGEIYQYILDVKPGYKDKYSAMDLRTVQDWIVRRQLSGIPGVVEINSWGGYLKQYEIAINPSLLRSHDITLMQVFDALKNNNSISGGAYIEKTNQSYFIRGDGQIKNIGDIENISIVNRQGVPVFIRDIAQVHNGYANRFGAITANGEGEKVLGQIMMLKNANSKIVINEVKKRVDALQKSLPEGVYINPILERSELISKTTSTIVENIVLGCIIVIFVVYLLLGNLRSSLVIASMIPLALFFTLSLMYVFGIDANLMSLGALDFGIIIDGAVIIVEFIVAQLVVRQNEIQSLNKADKQKLLDHIAGDGAAKMMRSAVFGQVIILIVFIPILSLSGVEGKMFRPMALTFSFAILGAMFLGLTWLPVAASLFLKPGNGHKKSVGAYIMDFAYRTYTPVLEWSWRHKKTVLGAGVVALIVTGIIFSGMGGEFVPTLDEGDFVIQPVLKTGTSLSKTVETTTRMEKILKQNFPDEVDKIVSRIGAAEVPTDPMSMEEIDMIIKLKPKNVWVKAHSKEELADKFKTALSIIPGIDYEFTQPIEMRFNELITGVRADIAVKLYGEDLNYLNKKATEIKKLIDNVPGAADVILEKTAGLPQISVKYNRDKIAYYGVDIEMLNKYLAMAFGGEQAGVVFEGEKRFDMTIRLQKSDRVDIDNIKELQVPTPGGQVPLSELAEIKYATGPAKISRDNTHRRVVVSVNVRNRDLQSVVKDIQKKISKNIKLEPGYSIAYGGQFENLQNATKRLMVAVPIAMALIFIFLHFAFKSMRDAIMIYTAVPLATVGGVIALWVRGMPFSVSAGIGFIALFGIAVLNGIVLIEHLKELKEKGDASMHDFIISGAKSRLRPVMLTAGAAAMGFLPMALSNGAGAEVQRPLATVVIGGLVTSTMLTMIALPLLFDIFYTTVGFDFKKFRLIRKSVLIFIGLLCSVSVASAQSVKKFSLDSVLNKALQNNLEIRNYQYAVETAKALKPSAFNIPKTQLQYSYDENNIAENGYPLKVVGVSQQISFPTVYISQYKMASVDVEIANAQLDNAKNKVVGRITKEYYEILYLLNKMNLTEQTDTLYERLLSEYEQRKVNGDISNLDLLNVKAKARQSKRELQNLKNDLEKAYVVLQNDMKYDTAFVITYQKYTPLTIQEPDLKKCPEAMLAQLGLKSQKYRLGLEKNNLLPDISFTYFNGTNKYTGARNYAGYQIGIGIPLFFNDQVAKIKSAAIGVKQSDNISLDTEKKLLTRFNSLKMERQKLMSAIDYYNNEGAMLSTEILRNAKLSYQNGKISFLEFAMSLENANKLNSEYLDNLHLYNNISIDMEYMTLE